MSVTIRPAVRNDCPRLLELIRELAEYERALHEVEVSLEHFEESGFGACPVWWGIVAESGDCIVGFALYYIRYSTWKGQRLYLEDIVVTEEFRGCGIGKMLFDAVLDDARKKNLNGVVWQVLEWNEPAINFYNKYSPTFNQEWITCTIERV
ncbi:GNAT family N-acetyltransferase [Methanospirillum hungatei]|jgi:ribosomal protein S18 acetylase RimI-like enzyme|uniref:GNAT family N-acetyltransferase n=1 Tax=Methanospirillum hungatei TaxID=2203 RepID=UPI0009CA2A30|nr:GNAT family N-acetyltransferase [Methanospirillum hungatei]MBP9008474.1 GNAT family N-acetyltransferase [Methanospirillum sp.]MCA1915957.1 GNAT family N-acetyltransferase [Methanospirillum hungatei]OQA55966.1 MAG: Acetyltransferase (GNAT) family protein [Euryarchaeota archaeon ADurb.Bin294]HOW05746.1 GNAT family N-acetyltransferase [Methanospirillum hungatei]